MASDTKLTVSLVLNDAGFSKQLGQVNKDLKLSQSEFKNASAGTETFEKTLAGAQAKLKDTAAQFELQQKKVNLYKEEISKTSTTLENLTKAHAENSSKLEAAKTKYEEICNTMGENSKEAKELKTEISDLEKTNGTLENRIVSTNGRLTTLNTGLNNAEAEFKELGVQVAASETALANFNTDQMKKKLEDMSASLEKTGKNFTEIGKGFNTASKMFASVAVPALAAGAAITKVSMDFQTSMSYVQAVSGATGDEFAALEAKARELGAKTSKSSKDAADALGYMGLAGWNTAQMMEGLEPILRLSEAGAFDLGLASDLVTDSMGALKKEVKELPNYLDVVAQASRKSNTDIQQLMEAFINVGATASNLKIPVTEASAALGILANNGTKGYEGGTKLNSILMRMTAQSRIAGNAWERVGISVYDADGAFRGLTTILSETKEKFAELTQEEQQYFVKQVAGTDNVSDFTNLMYSTNGEIQELTKNLVNSEGALNDMALTMQANVQGELYKLSSGLEELGLQFGEIVLPMVNSFIEKLQDLVTWFSSLSPEVKDGIVKFGLFAIAGMGVTKALSITFSTMGTVTSGLGKLVGAFSRSTPIVAAAAGAAEAAGIGASAAVGTAAAGTGLAGMAAALGGAAVAAAPFVAGAALIGVAGYGVYKVMSEEVVPAIDLYASSVEHGSQATTSAYAGMNSAYTTTVTTISEQTKTAVQSYMELDDKSREALQNLYVNSVKVTTELKEDVITKFTDMGSKAKDGLQTGLTESETILKDFLEESSMYSAETQATLLQQNSDFYTTKINDITEKENEVTAILQKAFEENRNIKSDEAARITEIQNEMRDNAIRSFSETEEEASIILGRLASYDERITSEMASKHIKEAEEMRIKSVDAATKEYNERVSQITKMKDEMGIISTEQADQMIAEAERQRDDSVAAAQGMKDTVVAKIKQMNEDALKSVDEQTGKMMTKLDNFKKWWDGLFFSKKTVEVDVKETKVSNYVAGVQGNGTGRSIQGFVAPDNAIATPLAISDTLEVPNAASYMNNTVQSLAPVVKSNDSEMGDLLTIMTHSLQQATKQNEMLMQLVGLMQSEKDVNVALQVDGRQIAKATAQYMSKEIDIVNTRKSRLGGKF